MKTKSILALVMVLCVISFASPVAGDIWHIQTVDAEGNVHGQTSLALDSGGNAHISYYDEYEYELKYAYIPEPATLLLLGLGTVMLRKDNYNG